MKSSAKFQKAILCSSLLLILCLFWDKTYVGASTVQPYEITEYTIHMRVDKKNTYHVQEKLVVQFNQQRHGIYRDIPVMNYVTREDGSSDRIQASVDHINCHGTPYSTKRSGANLRIKLGDEDKTLLGEKTYEISYQYHMGNDVVKDMDEFYYNVIGTGWDTSISNVVFVIEMPENIQEESVGMAYGYAGSTDSAGLAYTISDNVLTGVLDPAIVLQPGEAVTVRMTMPEGYFEKQFQIPWQSVLAIIIALLGVSMVFGMWYKVGRDNPVVETIQFHAPKGFNSLEVALLYRGKVQPKDVISLLVYLAQKGYIHIVIGSKDRINKNNYFQLQKVREYDGNNKVERYFMERLFAKGDCVGKGQLRASFYKTVDKIVTNMNSKQNRQVIFYANSINKHFWCVLLGCIVFIMGGYEPLYEYTYSMVSAIVMPILFGILFVSFVLLAANQKGVMAVINSLVSFSFLGIYMYGFYGNALRYAPLLYKIAFVVSIIACVGIAIFDHYMPKRTPYGTEMLGKTLGFQRFLKTAEKARIEMLVEREPEYFYDILPYAYVLDVTDAWMEKFEDIAMLPPHWYRNDTTGDSVNMRELQHFMHHTMGDVQRSMLARPSSSSRSGGHSGGGRSGGGSGGGGGGSW